MKELLRPASYNLLRFDFNGGEMRKMIFFKLCKKVRYFLVFLLLTLYVLLGRKFFPSRSFS